MSDATLTIGVAIPAYKRPADLLRCIDALTRQTLLPHDIIVTVRDIDDGVRAALARMKPIAIPLRIILLEAPGVVPARNAALAACRTDIIACLDDDTVPKTDWAARIVAHFAADTRLGGLGGKDHLHDGVAFNEGRRQRVGQLQWFGRVIADHHLGYGEARDVAMLKGANMAFRATAITDVRIDERLRGVGANEDLFLSLAVRRLGWTIRYDPAVEVDHFSGRRDEARHYSDLKPVTDVRGFRDWAFNEVVAIWSFLPRWRKIVFLIWSLAVGTRVCPGLVQANRFTPRLGWASWHRLALAQSGKLEAVRMLTARESRAGT